MRVTFERADLLDALTDLASAVAAEKTVATVKIVGGAALAISHMDRAATTDVTPLIVECGITCVDDAEVVFARCYPGEEMKDRARSQLIDSFVL